MSEKQVTKRPQDQPVATDEVGKVSEKKDDLLDYDDLMDANIKRLNKWRQVGQTGGQ